MGWLAALLLMALTLVAIRWLMGALGWGRWGSRTGSGTAMLGVALKEVEDLRRIQVRSVGGTRLRIGVTCGPGDGRRQTRGAAEQGRRRQSSQDGR